MTWSPWIGEWALGGYALLLGLKVAAAHLRISQDSKRAPHGGSRGSVTVLQPILGGDSTLEECLLTNLMDAGAEVSFVWLLDEKDATGQDAAMGALERAAGADPSLRSRVRMIRYAEPPNDVNPKSFKLAQGLPLADSEFVAVLDDDTTIDAAHVARALQALEEADLYTGLPAYRGGRGIGSRLIVGFVNASSAVTYLPAALAGPAVTLNGMFYVTRTRTLRALGGFGAITSKLCDDLAMARLYQRSGHVIHQGWTTQILRTDGLGVRAYWKKMHRWFVFMSVLVRTSTFPQRVALGTVLSLGPPLLWVGVVGATMEFAVTETLAATLVLRHLALGTLLKRASEGRARVPVFASVAAELLLPLHALHALLVPRIQWRSRRMRVHRDGTFHTAGRTERAH